MERKYISDEIYEQIKDFDHRSSNLTEEQKLLVDRLIINKELKERYKKFGLCEECKQPNTGDIWCQSCNSKHFQENFKNWTSGNSDVDKFIQESQLNAKTQWDKLEWVEYDRFENIEYNSKGGFGTIYKAIWTDGNISSWNHKTNQWNSYWKTVVVLKCLNNSKDITLKFLNEVKLHLKVNNSACIIKLHGITKESKTNNFMMVMQYADDGNLRQILNRDFNLLSWKDKLDILEDVACGLSNIHKMGLTHRDFHSGNILSRKGIQRKFTNIADLGLCKPANEKPEEYNKTVYGVLPYVAPEVLRGKKYTQESDVYSFGIIIYEVFNGLPPYHDVAHEELLALNICQGLRPKFNIKVPQLIEAIAKQCVDAVPSNRPIAEYLMETFKQWHLDVNNKDSEIYKQINEIDEFDKKHDDQSYFMNSSLNTELIYITHPQAIYTSRLLNFNNLPEPKNEDNDADCDLETEYSDSTKIDFTKVKFNVI
ncbi:hypothetical protein RclHR1_03100017 [Rhizophagus clarus]|uniref:Kinase-like domain-containing protein n=1 Tax=Rhizophagus clarus TaxID=94130 RepID=A0A2Z6R708_9GLOM|nr:hypothetical protein RclHR1_03100017 [Rhizophagus clarus]GES93912.1 kinase-like domain-containing protein [Rhizophagus clarus]